MKQIALCAIAALMLLSCSKKNSNTNPGNNDPDPGITLNDNEKMIVGSWVLERIVDSNFKGSDLVDVKDGIPYPCGQDDTYIFSADKTYYMDEGKDTCGSGGGPYGVQNWSIESDTFFNYKHGPSQLNSDGIFRKIDNNHFAVYATNYWWFSESTKKTFYYKRK